MSSTTKKNGLIVISEIVGKELHVSIKKDDGSFINEFFPEVCIIPSFYFDENLSRDEIRDTVNNLLLKSNAHNYRHLLNNGPSKDLAKFEIGQSVYFFGLEGRVWDGVIKEVSKIEALVQGKGLAWIPLDSLYLSLDEAYAARDMEEKEAKDKSGRIARAKSFKVGQEAYFIAMDCGVYKVLKCSIIDMEEHEASIKLDAVVRRSVVDSKDVFHTSLEATLNAFERNRSISPNG